MSYQPSSPRPETSATTKMIRLAAGVIIAIVVYTAGWFYFAGQAKSWLQDALIQQKDRQVSVDCLDLDIRGFPFRIGAFCSGVKIDLGRSGVAATLGAVRSAAQIYNPGHAVIEIDGPADVRTSYGLMTNANWTSLRSSVVTGLSGLERLAAESDKVRVDIRDPIQNGPLIADFKHGELYVRQNGNNVDIAMGTDALSIKTALLPVPLPLANVRSDVTLNDQADVLKGTKHLTMRASSGSINQITIDFMDNGSIGLSGPFQFDESGLLSGTFNLKLSKIDNLQKVLAASFPAAAEPINQVASVISGLSGGTGEATIKVNVRNGVITVAFFELGRIPPI